MSLQSLERLYAKKRTILVGDWLPIEERVSLEFYDVGADEFVKCAANENDSDEVSAEKMRKLIAKVLNASEEEVAKMDSRFFIEILDYVYDSLPGADNPRVQKMMARAEANKPIKQRLLDLEKLRGVNRGT